MDDELKAYPHPIICERADYVRDLEEKGHSIYDNACLNRTSGEQCSFFGTCAYLDQFRQKSSDLGVENTIRIYTHALLFLRRNEFERQAEPDLVIIDEAFLPSAVSNLPSVAAGDVSQHIRFNGNASLGFDLVECEPSPLNWSSAMFRKRRTENGEQTTEAVRDYHEVTAS